MLALPDARQVTLAGPQCRSGFKTVYNRTRCGAFAALECPCGHGHLHTHTGVLAERGLARPLLPGSQSIVGALAWLPAARVLSKAPTFALRTAWTP